MKEKIKVTAIVSNYASKQILIAGISVLCNQDFKQYEIILPDLGNFTKEEKTILSQFEKEHSNFKILRSPGKNRAQLFNEAARIAKGELLLFTESHCIVPKDWISKYATLFKNKKIDAAVGSRISVPSGSWVSLCGEAFHKKVRNRLSDLSYFDFHNSAIRKECFEKIGGLSEDIPCMAEFMLGACLHQQGIGIHYFPKISIHHFGDVALIDYSRWTVAQGEDRTRIFIKHGNRFMQKYFPNQKFIMLMPWLKLLRLPLLILTELLVYTSMIGFKIGESLHIFAVSCFFFSLTARASAAFGRIKALREHRK